MGLLDILSGDRLEESRKNMDLLIRGTDNLITEMKVLVKALESHGRTMKELRKAIEQSS